MNIFITKLMWDIFGCKMTKYGKVAPTGRTVAVPFGPLGSFCWGSLDNLLPSKMFSSDFRYKFENDRER